MSARRPPRLATWLLRNLGSGPHPESIAGDLQERFAAHPSRWWYRRQVLQAVLVSALAEIRSHKILATRAVVVAWISVFIVFSFGQSLMFWWRYVTVWSEWSILYAPDWWRVGWLNAGPLPVAYLGWLVGGLAVGLSHGRSRNSMLFLFIATALVVLAGFTIWMNLAITAGPRPFRPWLLVPLLGSSVNWRQGFLLIPVAILIGGIIGAGLRRSAFRVVRSRL